MAEPATKIGKAILKGVLQVEKFLKVAKETGQVFGDIKGELNKPEEEK